MENLTTFDDIIEGFKKLSNSTQPIDPSQWMSGAMKLSVLMEEEVRALIVIEHSLALMRKNLLGAGNTAVYSKMIVEASDEYKLARLQKARIDNAKEIILLSKKNATLASEQMRNGL